MSKWGIFASIYTSFVLWSRMSLHRSYLLRNYDFNIITKLRHLLWKHFVHNLNASVWGPQYRRVWRSGRVMTLSCQASVWSHHLLISVLHTAALLVFLLKSCVFLSTFPICIADFILAAKLQRRSLEFSRLSRPTAHCNRKVPKRVCF